MCSHINLPTFVPVCALLTDKLNIKTMKAKSGGKNRFLVRKDTLGLNGLCGPFTHETSART